MEIFWVVVGVVVVILFLVNQNKSRTHTETRVRGSQTVDTPSGKVTIETVTTHTSTRTEYGQQSVKQTETISAEALKKMMDSRSPPPPEAVIQRKNQQTIAPVTINKPVLIEAKQQKSSSSKTTITEQTSKVCTRCSRNLPLDKFRKSSKSHHDGYTTWCAHCLDGPKNTRHTKWCPICEIRRKRTSYYKNTNNPDGLMSWCKSCWDSYKGRY